MRETRASAARVARHAPMAGVAHIHERSRDFGPPTARYQMKGHDLSTVFMPALLMAGPPWRPRAGKSGRSDS
jgi:hypothetical protein